jgi:hypothetical protein
LGDHGKISTGFDGWSALELGLIQSGKCQLDALALFFSDQA